MKISVSPDAARELEEAALWYEAKEPGLGFRLIDDFERCVETLTLETPPLSPILGVRGTWQLLLRKFPFSIVVLPRDSEMVILALAHHSRSPGYWRKRLNI